MHCIEIEIVFETTTLPVKQALCLKAVRAGLDHPAVGFHTSRRTPPAPGRPFPTFCPEEPPHLLSKELQPSSQLCWHTLQPAVTTTSLVVPKQAPSQGRHPAYKYGLCLFRPSQGTAGATGDAHCPAGWCHHWCRGQRCGLTHASRTLHRITALVLLPSLSANGLGGLWP